MEVTCTEGPAKSLGVKLCQSCLDDGRAATPTLQATLDPAACDSCRLRREAVQAFGIAKYKDIERNSARCTLSGSSTDINGHTVIIADVNYAEDERSGDSDRDQTHERPHRLELNIATSLDGDLSWIGCKQIADVSNHSNSADCFGRITQWMDDCSADHTACQKPSESAEDNTNISENPTRLVDTGPLDKDISLRLVDWPGRGSEVVKYCALSYSWGQDTRFHFTTTAETYEQRKHGIQIDQLPQTLRDAVTITRKVGCRYLWIDAICIVQCDRQDWEAESPRMNHIYGNAFLVIAATENASPGDGIFAARPPVARFNYLLAGKSYRMSVMERDNHGPWRQRYRLVETQTIPKEPPLHTRGWAYQERLLATRIIHYTANELVWECNTHCRCECTEVQQHDPSNAFDIGKSHKSQFIGDLGTNKGWRSIIEHYSMKHLTVQSDKLPALSGLARRFASPNMGRYLAGIWYSQLPDALCWVIFDSRKPGEYRAPSWSWVSLDGGEVLGIGRSEYTEGVDCVEVLEAECTPAGQDQYGAVSDGHIVLRGEFGPLDSASVGTLDETWALKMKSYGWSLTLKRSKRVEGAWERVDAEHVHDEVFAERGQSVVRIV